MSIEVKVLNADSETDYQQLIMHAPGAMFNHSLRYRKFLQRILEAEDCYLLAYESGALKGALPLFLKQGPLGAVVNSLPFFGSHGAVVARPNANKEITQRLLTAFTQYCEKNNAISSTIIQSPFESNPATYSGYKWDYLDKRIGQITKLPRNDNSSSVPDSLLRLFHQKTRNMVRKGLKGGFTVRQDDSQKAFDDLHAMHEENIRSVGGIAKSKSVYETIRDVFRYDEDYRIYTAWHNDKIVSALLVFYFKGIVEYYTPVILKAYRSQQPLSMLIFLAMRDAIVERSAEYWNWGGTWSSQTGVYRFKSRWGTIDHPYHYFVRVYPGIPIFDGMSKSNLLNSYPHFYTVPFSVLGSA